MKTTFYQVFLFIAGIIFSPHISGQAGVADLDSVPIIPNSFYNKYKFFDQGAKEIKLSYKQPKLVKDKANSIFRDIGNGALTIFTGIGFSSSTDVNWKIAGTIECNDTLPDWNVNLFCEGFLNKDRERVRNDDGSWSVETKETRLYYWDKDATGVLIEGNDTIGFFLIIMNPREDKLLKSWSDDIFPPQQVQQNIKSKNKFALFLNPPPALDYGITGIFREKNFSIISSGTDGKLWILLDNVFICIFQSEPDYSGMSKKYRIIPYLLINKNIPAPDRRDLFRLAIISRFLSHSLR